MDNLEETAVKAFEDLDVRAPDKAATAYANLTAPAQRATYIARATELHATANAKSTADRATVSANLTATVQRATANARNTASARQVASTALAIERTARRATVDARATRSRTYWQMHAKTRAAADAMTTPTPTPYRVSVDSAVNLRSGPGTNHAKVGVAQPGDTFAVIGYQSGSPYNWLKVRYDGGVAWIAESLTRLHR